MGKFIIEDRQQHAINEIASRENNITQKTMGNMTMKETGLNGFNEVFVFTLSHPILLRYIGT